MSGDVQGAQTTLNETVAALENMEADSPLAWTLISRIQNLLELGSIDAAEKDWVRIGKLSAPGVDPVLDSEAAQLKGSIAA